MAMAKIININYKEIKNDDELLEIVNKEIDEAINLLNEKEEETTISISNIISSHFCELFDVEPEEFNGWQCDWWSRLLKNGEELNIFGEAWYGNVEISTRL
jgi:hypothetical protein